MRTSGCMHVRLTFCGRVCMFYVDVDDVFLVYTCPIDVSFVAALPSEVPEVLSKHVGTGHLNVNGSTVALQYTTIRKLLAGHPTLEVPSTYHRIAAQSSY